MKKGTVIFIFLLFAGFFTQAQDLKTTLIGKWEVFSKNAPPFAAAYGLIHEFKEDGSRIDTSPDGAFEATTESYSLEGNILTLGEKLHDKYKLTLQENGEILMEPMEDTDDAGIPMEPLILKPVK